MRLRVGGVAGRLDLARDGLLIAKVPIGAMTGMVTLEINGHESNSIPLQDRLAYGTKPPPGVEPSHRCSGESLRHLEGSRGQEVPVSVYKISPRGILTPFVHDIVNPTGMAFGPDGEMYISSRFDGQVYRVTAEGRSSVFAHNLGVATGIAFDPQGYLYVGDREGTIYRVNRNGIATVSPPLHPASQPFTWPLIIRGIYT